MFHCVYIMKCNSTFPALAVYSSLIQAGVGSTESRQDLSMAHIQKSLRDYFANVSTFIRRAVALSASCITGRKKPLYERFY